MTIAFGRAPARAVSVSVSALMWAAAIASLVIGGRMAVTAPVAPPEQEPFTLVFSPPPPPIESVSQTRQAPSPRETPAPTPLASPAPAPLSLDAGAVDPGLSLDTSLPPPAPVVLDPHWVKRPAGLEHYYPARALARGKTGEVLLDCLVARTGRLSCSVVSETPKEWGFGAAALRISQDYQMTPAMLGGSPVEARYAMRVPFALD